MFRIAIIGCGSISAVHAAAIARLEGAVLAAAADVIPERAEAMASRYGCAAFTDWLKMLDDVRPDAVHICTPHHLHPVMAMEAARRGVAVFTEKPPAIDRNGWETVRRAAETAPVGVCFQNRYLPHVIACREMIEQNTYGALRGIRAFVTWNRGADYYRQADWKGKWATEGGGALINQAIHTLDLALYFLGAPDTAEATFRNHHLRGAVEVDDTAEIFLARRGVPALIYASTALSRDAPVIIELHLEKAVVRLEGDGMEILADDKVEKRTSQSSAPGVPPEKSYWGAGHAACIADFYRCISLGTPFRNSPDGCETTMRVLLDLYARCPRDLG